MPLDDSDYIELRCRSAFSFLDAASNPEDLIERAADLDYPALALGDRDGFYGNPRFHQAARAAGLRPWETQLESSLLASAAAAAQLSRPPQLSVFLQRHFVFAVPYSFAFVFP